MKPLHLLPLAALVLSAAHAGLPLSTEDAEVLAPRDCEFEAGALSLHEPAINSQEQVLNLSCGVGANTQLGLATGRLKAGDERSQQLALGGKFSFWQGDDGAGAAFAAALLWERHDGGWRQSLLDLNAIYSRRVADGLTTHLNLGHRRDRTDGRQSTTWGAALEHEGYALGTLTLAPMAELFGNDRHAPWWSAGLRLMLLPDELSVALSYGRQMDSERARLATASLKLAF